MLFFIGRGRVKYYSVEDIEALQRELERLRKKNNELKKLVRENINSMAKMIEDIENLKYQLDSARHTLTL